MIIQQSSYLIWQFCLSSKIYSWILSWYSGIVKVIESNSWITKELVLYSKLLEIGLDSWISRRLLLQSRMQTICYLYSELTKIFTTKSSVCRIIEGDSIIFIEE